MASTNNFSFFYFRSNNAPPSYRSIDMEKQKKRAVAAANRAEKAAEKAKAEKLHAMVIAAEAKI